MTMPICNIGAEERVEPDVARDVGSDAYQTLLVELRIVYTTWINAIGIRVL